MKAILMSIKPQWVEKILNGEKTIEIRKTLPKCDLPIDVYIYCTKDKKYANLINRGGFLTGMVVAKFTLNKVEKFYNLDNIMLGMAYLNQKQIHEYMHGKECAYAWHIDNLEIFDRPKPLQPFFDLDRPPQSWCYIEV